MSIKFLERWDLLKTELANQRLTTVERIIRTGDIHEEPGNHGGPSNPKVDDDSRLIVGYLRNGPGRDC